MRRVASSAALLLTAALLAGCGGSGGKASGSSSTSPPTNAPATDHADFAKLLGNFGKQAFKVTYTDAGGNTQMYAQDGKGNTVTINGDERVYTTKSAAITCSRASDAAPFTCTQSPIDLGASSSYIALAVAERTYAIALAYKLAHTSQKNIAGHDADCFSITAADFDGARGIAAEAGASLQGSAEYCNDHATGALLENTITDPSGEMTTNLVVTNFQSPSPSDFQPPAVPTIDTTPAPVTVPGGVGAQ